MNSVISFFYFLSFLTVLSAVMVVVSRNPIHSVLYLILTFFTLSGHYILLNAQFLAAVNIIVYAGAIMVLFLFVIMFLNMKQDNEESKTNLTKIAATIVGGTVFVILFGAYRKSIIPGFDPQQFDSQIGMIENLGHLLFRDYLLPFELVSILLLVAMVGAVMLGKREIGERHF
ncbi:MULTISPECIES: NADH-quinone oxidoreductase subunit J [Dyadobacter]|jgi:NADH-quinone oxidoreductase subunit J|uniref:NADH-quinone oxidoreductase subunit J n=1 Tax=Dyadobacter chenhuakuii TaxID=2909339 RepID=A0A9X1QEQ3_9BACT|nr:MULTISPECIES: NADH-quinone oxidoreductase subunit J [Dyadobacter]MCE7068913.1 NADH-quinone oxidoreductase subunit J [Dyadobacter sp. CY327]MCF2495549.1 NADH-quinone oxidoreductase subunit J [Dyadobacter chenhuakuii]MCF2499981.1 NADH-quinone oxidoreductase subunit J [Dyadobacter chenhuakuii]MCF2520222.1 NADH-quinone oxidoreductase subunit J [Dyadobacter sp. CY351]USJ29586.1 NADH-quinone oxidoreductase subunit J [Dyadobacter chenhuakuii]